MKKRGRRLLEACAFVLLLCAVVTVCSRLLERKQSRNLFGGFLKEPDAYDVLFFGDSQMMNGMLPMDMWQEYGIAGYNLSCYGNTLPTTYWAVRSALDYAQPRLAVIAVNGIHDLNKVTNYSGDLHTAMDFWPLTDTKVSAIDDLLYDVENPDFTDIEGYRYRDLNWEFYIKLGKYHSRWSELNKGDFQAAPAYARGGEMLTGVTPIWSYTLAEEDDYADEMGHGFVYLRRAIELCQSRGVEVLLVQMPSPTLINAQRCANTVRSIAQEYGVDFVDTTYLDSIVDYAVDCYDTDPHLNVSGSLKMTSFLGSYIQSRYNLPDRHGEAHYAAWNDALAAYHHDKMERLCSQTELHSVLMLLHDQAFDVKMVVPPDSAIPYDELAILLMHNLARERVRAGEEYDMSSALMYPLEQFDRAIAEGLPYCLVREDGVVTEYIGKEAETAASAVFGEAMRPGAVTIEVAAEGEQAVQMQF